MPSITTANTLVTSFSNEFVSPYGNDTIIPLYSSIPINYKIANCLPCIICGNSSTRNNVLQISSQNLQPTAETRTVIAKT